MSLPFKYTSTFYQNISLSNTKEEEHISSASLESLKQIAPEGIDFEKNIDLVGIAFNAAVANRFNKNGDGIDSATAVAIKDYFIHKPTNIEHQKQKIVGHVVGASLSSFEDSSIITPEEAIASDGPFNIALSAVVYKTVNPDFAELVEKSTDEASEFYQTVSASWEIGFNDYSIVVGSKDLHKGRLIPESEKEEYAQFLKAYGGNGRTDNGEEVYRLIMGDIYPVGIGFTANPAAEVKGVVLFDKKPDYKAEENDSNNKAFDRLKIKNNILKEKSSHLPEGDVIFNKSKKSNNIMEKEILQQVTETLEAQASSKKLSEEAIANITKVFHDAIIQKNDQWQTDKENLLKEKEDLQKAAEASSQEIESLKKELASVNEEISSLKTEVSAREEAERFNERMSELDDTFELEDEDRVVLASELKNLSTSEEAYAEYKEKLNIVWKHKTKAFKEEQEKILKDRIEEEVQKRLSSLASNSEASEVSSEEAEEVIENAQAEEEVVANNNAESIEEEISLRDKFKQAFSRDSVEIKY